VSKWRSAWVDGNCVGRRSSPHSCWRRSGPLRAEGPGCRLTDAALPSRVRALTPPVEAALWLGVRRSPTLARLVDQIDRSDAIVYIDSGVLHPRIGGRLRGGLSHQIVAGPTFRLLHVVVLTMPGDEMIVTIAHELRHAIEVIETRTRSISPASDCSTIASDSEPGPGFTRPMPRNGPAGR